MNGRGDVNFGQGVQRWAVVGGRKVSCGPECRSVLWTTVQS